MTDTSADAADVAKVLGGDVEAFEAIVRRWQGPLLNLAWRFCRDRARAEDMAQEAFIKAYRSLAGYRGEAAFSTWLIALAMNVYRSRMRRLGPPLVDLAAAGDLADHRSPRQRLEGEERARAVRYAVSTLPARYRDVILLFYFRDMDVAETARLLGLPVGTVKARLHRGREMLRRRFASLLRGEAAAQEALEEA